MTDPIAERVRKVGGTTIRSIGQIAALQRVRTKRRLRDPAGHAGGMREDNRDLAAEMRETHDLCDEHRDIASASLMEVWMDETERRNWFLFEASRTGDATGH